MREQMTDTEEERIYYILCKISKKCKNYFYDRKYIPFDRYSLERKINEIIESAENLKKVYSEINQNRKEIKED